ncbi:hypothetical protein IJ670_08035, partial [bacterium]|nr:hypothetical protein [bacterium]
AKDEELIKHNAKKLLIELNNRVVTTPLLCPILAQLIDNRELAFNLWTKNLQYASYIGDVNIYSMAQKQSLILLEGIEHEYKKKIKNNICEKLGKLLYIKSSKEAKNYLTNALIAAQDIGDTNKVIDISGYLVKCLYNLQDFGGVIEIVDNVIKCFENPENGDKKRDYELQIALIKTRKLEALLALGSWEKIASMVQCEINPVLRKHLGIFSKHKWVKYGEIYFSWVEANIILAQSYCEQGSPLAFELIDEINKFLSREKGIKIDALKVRLAYASAIANTSRGYFVESDNILQGILQDYAYIMNNPRLICKWNVVNIINEILSEDVSSIKNDLFEATTYANNCGDNLSKNLLKTLLGYVFLQEKNYLKAIEIATSQVQYFSEEKIAFGALLAWYISAAAMAQQRADKYCIEICEKAVKICEDAQSINFYFKIMFQELLAKSYLKLNDLENAHMYCDLAMQSANANELLYLQLRLNNLKANIMRENLSEQSETSKEEYARNIMKIYNKTIEMAKMLNLVYIIKKIEKELTSFRAYCQLNRIIEDK